MAVMQNSIIFGGINSADFGIYIGGEGVFNAPKRAVEMVTVPGRNGDIAIDQGHYENIEVTYSAFNYEEDLATFAKNLSDFRNAIASQVGYQRLTDTFHPDEYRMAIYTDGLEIDPIKYNTASEFELKFNCKPQRWLTAGEVPVTIGEWGATKEASGEIVTIESEGGEAAKSLVVELEPIQSGSGEPSPDNVRPISGRTEVVTNVAGKNLLHIAPQTLVSRGITWTANADGTVTAKGTLTDASSAVSFNATVPTGSYKFNGSGTGSASATYYAQVIDGSQWYNPDYGNRDVDVAISSTNVRVYFATKTNPPSGGITFKPMLRLASETDATFEPYNGNTYTTSLGRTVYGGTLDVVSGVLTVYKVMLEWLSSSNFGKGSATTVDEFFLRPSLAGVSGSWLDAEHIICSHAKNVESTSGVTAPYPQMGNGQPRIVFPLSMGMSLANFKTWLDEQQTNGTPLQVCYMLATPQTYQLTPQQISLLVGENHVFSDGAITMQYGDDPNSLWNPTRYDAGPLLITDGYGTISFNGYDIEITHVPVGWVTLVNRGEKYLTTALPNASGQYSVKWNSELLQTGDTINVASRSDRAHKITFGVSNLTALDTYTYSNSNPNAIDMGVIGFAFDNISFTAGTANTITNTLTVTPTGSGSSASWTGSISYDGDSTITFSISKASTNNFRFEGEGYVEWDSIESNSTAQAFGRPTYIDCELGEAYKIENDEIISLNKYLDLGSDLPKLSPGANDVTTDNTITELKVVPNWWKL